jgi:hypothetical protein
MKGRLVVKKILLVAILLVSMTSFALAEQTIDLSQLSYEDLIALKMQVDAEIISRPETNKITVPQGVYTVGVHIPAGEYRIEASGLGLVFHLYSGISTDIENIIDAYYIGDDKPLGRVILTEDNIVSMDGPAIFIPFVGLDF